MSSSPTREAAGTVVSGTGEPWKAEVGVFFNGVGPDSPDAELRRTAPDHPVFRITVKP